MICDLSRQEGEYRYRKTRGYCEWQHIPQEAVPVEVREVTEEVEWTVIARSTVLLPHRRPQIATFEQYIEDLSRGNTNYWYAQL